LIVCIAWWPVLLWGSFTRTTRVQLHALLAIVAIYCVAVASLIDVGGLPGAAAGLLLPIVLAGVFFGRRAAWWTTGLVVLTSVAVGAMFRARWFPTPDPALTDVSHLGVWLRMAATQATIGLVLVSAVTTLLRRYERSLEETRNALRDLAEEQERRQREAQEAVRRRDDFLAIASHELRTPLTPLLLEVQALQRRARRGDLADQSAELAARLQKTIDHVQRLARLVDEILDVSQILAGKLTVHLEPVDLAAVVKGVTGRFAGPLARSGSSLALRGSTECVGLWDRSRLAQVVTNLLSNAIKYGAGKPIELSLEAMPDVVTLVVRDHGIGIEDEARARVFGRFERAVPSEHYGGFGVGLWVVKQILDALDGQVRLDSAPGAGTTIFVALPRGVHAGSEPERRLVDHAPAYPGDDRTLHA
jgi:signal transduction histidine kinase